MSSQPTVDEYGYAEEIFAESYLDAHRERMGLFFEDTYRKLFGTGMLTMKTKRISGGHTKIAIELPKFVRPSVPDRDWCRRFFTRWMIYMTGASERDIALFEGDKPNVSIKIVVTLWLPDILK